MAWLLRCEEEVTRKAHALFNDTGEVSLPLKAIKHKQTGEAS